MNELQLVLIIFAMIVISWLLYLGQQKKCQQEKREQKEQLNKDCEGKILVSGAEIKGSIVSERQDSVSFGENFDPASIDNLNTSDASDKVISDEGNSQHYVINDESLISTKDVEGPIVGAAGDTKPSFGKPKSVSVVEEVERLVETSEPKVFVIILIGSKEFSMPQLNQSLLGVGLSHNNQGIYAKLDNQGNEIIHVANIMEPGNFPVVGSDGFNQVKVSGIALILSLPTTVKAPAAMNDMIAIARKVSDKMNCRLYNGERKLLKQSEIKSMRESAIAYETVSMTAKP